MKAKTKFIYVIAATASLLLSVIGGICLTIAFQTQFNATIQHFDRGAVLPTVAYVFIGAAYLPAIVCAVMAALKDKSSFYKNDSTPVSVFCKFLCALMFLVSFGFAFANPLGITDKSTVELLTWFSLLFSGAALFAGAFTKLKPSSNAATSIFPIVWGIVSMLVAYFDDTIALNSPLKSIRIIAYATALLFFLGEARLANEKRSVSTYTLFSLASVPMIAYVIPMIAARFSKAGFSMGTVIETALIASVWLYAVSQVITAALSPEYIPVDTEAEADPAANEAEVLAEPATDGEPTCDCNNNETTEKTDDNN